MKIKVEIYLNERYYHSLTYEWDVRFEFAFENVVKYVYKKLPLLKYRKDVEILLDEERFDTESELIRSKKPADRHIKYLEKVKTCKVEKWHKRKKRRIRNGKNEVRSCRGKDKLQRFQPCCYADRV